MIRAALRRPSGAVGLVLVGLALLAATLGPALYGASPLDGDLENRHHGVSKAFPLGADFLGRDQLARILQGARTSLGVGLFVAGVTVVIAVAVGLVAGYAGGIVDSVLMRTADVFLAFPSLVLALAIAGLLGPSLRNAVIALIVVWWSGLARVIRSEVLAIRRRGYVEAAESAGGGPVTIALRHVLPNVSSTIIVLGTLDIGAVILALAALSFLGLGNQPPAPEWGRMLFDAKPHLQSHPLEMLAPGGAIVLTVLGFMLLGDALRDASAERSA